MASNDDWTSVNVYPGAEMLILQNYDIQLEKQKQTMKYARYAVCVVTALKLGLYYANE